MAKKSDKDKLATIRERYKRAVDYDRDNRREALDDIKFVTIPGHQWDEAVLRERGQRIALEFNRLRVTIKRVVNDMRMARPAGKVLPTEDADRKTAMAYEGLIRNIWNQSNGDSTIDQAAEYMVMGGMGAWRINTRYSRDDAWDQDLVVEQIANPLCLYRDPASRLPDGSDAEYWFLTSRVSRTAFEAKYGKKAISDFDTESEFDDDDEWESDDYVRLVEYWYKEPTTETLLLLSDGRSVRESDLTPQALESLKQQGVQVLKSRQIQTHKVRMCIASGSEILEEADWVGSQFPFVVIYGDLMVVDGRQRWWGLTRHSRDAQTGYNYSRTLAIETIALAPQSKFWATPDQAVGHTDKWSVAHKELMPFMLYNADPKAPGTPVRMPGADIPAAWINEIQLSGEDIKATSGIFDASLGARTNESSGVAIRQRQIEGSMATWNFSENLARGIRRTWELLVDAIPKVYDTPRSVRALGMDNVAEYMMVNDGLLDLSRGKYDVTISTGPSFSTQRQEAAEVYAQFAQANPAVFPVAGDLIFKALDLPYADKIADRLKTLLPPQIQQMEAQGTDVDPQVMMAMAQAEQAMAQVQQMGAQVQMAAQELEAEKAGVEREKLGIATQKAQFQVAEAQIAKQVAEFQRLVAETQAKMATSEAAENGEQNAAEREQLIVQVDAALQAINEQAAQFMAAAAQMLAQMQAIAVQPVVVEKPTNKVVSIKRVNGGLVGTVVDQDSGKPLREVQVQRIDGGMVGQVTEVG